MIPSGKSTGVPMIMERIPYKYKKHNKKKKKTNSSEIKKSEKVICSQELEKRKQIKEGIIGKKPSKFEDIKTIYIKDICLDGVKASEKSINEAINFYNKNGFFRAPVYVFGFNNELYKVVLNEDILLAAKELERPTVWCKYLVKEEAVEEELHRIIGKRIEHINNGKGTIVNTSEKDLFVEYDNGEINEIGLDICVKLGLISFLD